MNKEQKVISLELAKELQQVAKENGFELPESEYVHCKNFWLTKWKLMRKKDGIWGSWVKDGDEYRVYPAYDTSELGEILPKKFRVQTYWQKVCYFTEEEFFVCAYESQNDWRPNDFVYWKKGKTEAEARGKMFIYLIKNKLI